MVDPTGTLTLFLKMDENFCQWLYLQISVFIFLSGACKFRRKSSMPAAVMPHGRLLEKPAQSRVARRHSCAQVVGIAPPSKHVDCENDSPIKPTKRNCNCTFTPLKSRCHPFYFACATSPQIVDVVQHNNPIYLLMN